MKQDIKTMKVSEIKFRDDLYPRINKDPITVQKYAETIDVLPPIEINQHSEIIDGWHRWTAYKKLNIAEIPIKVTNTNSDAELFELAIERNAIYGLQLSQADKKDAAHRIYNATPEKEREEKKKQLIRILSVSERTIREWLSRIDKDTKEKRDKRIFEHWLACDTYNEIADLEGLSEEGVRKIVSQLSAELPEVVKAGANHITDFEIPLYNVWKQQTKSSGSRHPGNSEVRWLDNLLYLYTQPLDIVVDPFAGGGSTIDLCKKRLRRYWVSDRKPVVEREQDIRKYDVVDGLPPLPHWKDVKLVYLDPPYWKQAKGAYSNDASDFSNMDIATFNQRLSELIISFASKLKQAYIALIIQPTQWNSSPNHEFVDHVGDMLRLVKLPCDMRYSVPYESQQNNAQMVEWAKEHKKCLVLTREIVVWRVG